MPQHIARFFCSVLKVLWDLVTRVAMKSTIAIFRHDPVKVLITVLAKSHEPPTSRHVKSSDLGVWVSVFHG